MKRRRRAEFSRFVGRMLYGLRPLARGPASLDGVMIPDEIQRMFQAIAGSYDLQNRFLSMWLDAHWRNVFVRYLRLPPTALLGDIAVGTAEITIRACRRYPGIRVIGIDFSPEMLRVARRKLRERGIDGQVELRQGDMRALPVQDELFDAVSISFGIRNVRERDRVLQECYRVLKPGARLFVMEPGFLDVPLLGGAYRFYFDRVMPLFGNLLSGTDYAYTYLAESVYDFPSDEAFIGAFQAAGFKEASAILVSYGLARIYRGRKPARADGGRAEK